MSLERRSCSSFVSCKKTWANIVSADPLSLMTISVRSSYGTGRTGSEVWSCDTGPVCHRIDSTLLYAGGNSREFHNSELIGLYEEVIEGVSIK